MKNHITLRVNPALRTMLCSNYKLFAENLNRKLFMAITLAISLCSFNRANAQTFNYFISNDHLVSPTVFEFDVSIANTSGADFLFRTAQHCFTFNPAFINGATITASYVSASTQMVNYAPGSITWSAAANGFQTAANTGVACSNGTIIPASGAPKRVATFRLTATTDSFACVPSNPNMVMTGDVPAPSGLALRMAITKWNDNTCALGNNSTITGPATQYTRFATQTQYGYVNNNPPPTVLISGNSYLCPGSTGLLYANVTGEGSVLFTAWYWNQAYTGQYTPTCIVYGAGTYFVYAVTTNGCTALSSNFVVSNATSPTITCPGNQAANTASNSCSAAVTYSSSPTTTGTAPVAITYTFTGATTNSGTGSGSGSTFNKGTTTVTLTATNGCGTATCSFNVVVTDVTPPTIACPGATTVAANNAGCIYSGSIGTATGSDNCGTATISGPIPAGPYSVGTTTVTWTATDETGNTASCTQMVTVTNPVTALITPLGTTTFCQGDFVVLDAGVFTSYNWSTGATTQTISVNTAESFTVTVTDANGCTGSTSVTTTVNENSTPTITGNLSVCPGSSTTLDAGVFASYNWSTGETTQTITVSTAGTFTVTVANANGCTAMADPVTLTVEDTQAPTITCASAITVNANNAGCSYLGAIGSPTIVDNCSVTLTSSPAAPYPVGTTNVTWLVTDAGGNTASCVQMVTVVNSLTATASGTNVSCFGGSDGSATASSTGAGYACNSYSISSIPYQPIAGSGTQLTLSDDEVTAVPIGFDFNFYCYSYSDAYISSNGFIAFDSFAGPACCSGQFIPSDDFLNNMIAWNWDDLYPPGGGSITYQTIGIAPFRKFIVSYINIPHSGWSSPPLNSGQIILYETTNVIEIHNTEVTDDGNVHTQGIENANGTVAIAAPGRNSTNWTTTNDAYRFTQQSAVTYLWDNGQTTATATGLTAGNYTCIITDANGCTSIASYTVGTMADVTPPTINCPSATTVDANNAGCTYTGTIGTATATDNCSATVSGPIPAGPYSLGTTVVTWTATDAAGNTASCTQSVTVTNPVTAIITPLGPTTFCQGGSVTLDAGVFAGYNWSTGETTQTISVNTADTFTVTVTNANGCTGSTSVTTTVNATSTSTTDIAICPSELPYSWNGLTFNAAGSQTKTGLINSVGCDSSATLNLTVNANPTPSISGTLSFCAGGSATLNAGTFTSYSWSTGAITQTISVNTAGTFTVTVTNASGCSGSVSATTAVNPNLNPSITGILSLCSGGSTTLNAGAGYSSYNWSTGATTQTISVNTAGTFTVTVTNGSGCTGSAQAITTATNGTFSVSITGASAICSGSSTTLNAGAGYSSYHWSTGATTQTISVNTAGTFVVTVTTGQGCTSSASVTTTVIASVPSTPTAINGKTGDVYGYCPGGTYTFTTTSTNATGYNWTIACGTIVSGQGTKTVTVLIGSNFSHCELEVKASNCKGLSGDRELFLNSVLPAPTVSGSNSACKNSNTPKSFTVSGTTGATSYTWSSATSTVKFSTGGTPVNPFTTTATSVSVNFFGVATGTKTIQVKANNVCGSGAIKNKNVNITNCSKMEGDGEITTSENSIVVFPNPAHDEVNISFESAVAGVYNLKVINITGQVVLSETKNAAEGNNNYVIDAKNLAAGLYTVILQSGETIMQTRIVKE